MSRIQQHFKWPEISNDCNLWKSRIICLQVFSELMTSRIHYWRIWCADWCQNVSVELAKTNMLLPRSFSFIKWMSHLIWCNMCCSTKVGPCLAFTAGSFHRKHNTGSWISLNKVCFVELLISCLNSSFATAIAICVEGHYKFATKYVTWFI